MRISRRSAFTVRRPDRRTARLVAVTAQDGCVAAIAMKGENMRGRSESFISLGLAFVALASLASAQITTGAIRGTVTDSTGSVVPKVKVQAKNLATGQAFSAD